MSLAARTRIGPYEITAAIGAGGMGEVYRGHDPTLNRDVAIKVLPAALAADTERLARFKREAQLLASLSHSNIAHVYGFEAATLPDGSTAHFLAMELVEGEDLSERLKRGRSRLRPHSCLQQPAARSPYLPTDARSSSLPAPRGRASCGSVPSMRAARGLCRERRVATFRSGRRTTPSSGSSPTESSSGSRSPPATCRRSAR